MALVSGAVVMVLALSFGYVGFYLLRWLLDRLRQTELLGEVRWMRVGRTAPQPIPIVHHPGIGPCNQCLGATQRVGDAGVAWGHCEGARPTLDPGDNRVAGA